jgi:hypothetical protein
LRAAGAVKQNLGMTSCDSGAIREWREDRNERKRLALGSFRQVVTVGGQYEDRSRCSTVHSPDFPDSTIQNDRVNGNCGTHRNGRAFTDLKIR